MALALTVSKSTKTRGREHMGWAGSPGNVATTHRWNGVSKGHSSTHCSAYTLHWCGSQYTQMCTLGAWVRGRGVLWVQTQLS